MFLSYIYTCILQQPTVTSICTRFSSMKSHFSGVETSRKMKITLDFLGEKWWLRIDCKEMYDPLLFLILDILNFTLVNFEFSNLNY